MVKKAAILLFFLTILCFAFGSGIAVVRRIPDTSMRNLAKNLTFVRLFVGYQGILTGVYIYHWEMATFEVPYKGQFGLKKIQRCSLRMKDGVEYPFAKWGDEKGFPTFGPARKFLVTLEGTIIAACNPHTTGRRQWILEVERFIEVKMIERL